MGQAVVYLCPIGKRIFQDFLSDSSWEYACLFTYHMPYENQGSKGTLKWIHSQNMESWEILWIYVFWTQLYNKDIKKIFV